MSAYRRDRRSGAWVIVAPERGQRPHAGRVAPAPAPAAPAHDADCPFCPGNEHLLPGIIAETAAEEAPGWSVRVVPNKYPALRAEAPLPAEFDADEPVPGFGHHEVIVETPRHDVDLPQLAAPGLAAVVATYRSRAAALAARPGVKSVVVFRNSGHGAGASLRHPHSQIIATGIMPPRLAAAADWARAWFGRTNQCPTCRELHVEAADGSRLVEATDRFLVFVPFAAAGPYEVRIVPRRHQPSFTLADDGELAELGTLLQRTIRRLNALLARPSYNYAIESGAPPTVDAASFHWCVRIVPILGRPGGFELASGMPINPSLPEDDAAALRAVEIAAARTPRIPQNSAKEDEDDPTIER